MSAARPVPGLVIAATRSGSGKTVVTLGLMRALRRQGLRVAGRKNGPDYIDPAFHAAATGRPSFNLDSWAMPPAQLLALAAPEDPATDLVICEGSMGLFDGVPAPSGRSGSSADVAALLGWPVVLVHDCSGQAQSAAALLKGCALYDPRIRIAGVILNRIGSARHRRLVSEAVTACGIAVLGSLPREDAMALPERHLGLVQAEETLGLDARIEALADRITEHVDLAALLAAAGAAPDVFKPDVRPPLGVPTEINASNWLPSQEGKTGPVDAIISVGTLRPPGRRIAIARDAAFSFLYPHVLAGWRARGAELSFFSPLKDEAPPLDCDAAWLPGGYPELHAGPLARASRFLGGLRHFAETRPVHGECGGYMVLGRSLTDAEGVTHAMAGLLSVETSFARRKLNLGYRDARLLSDCGLGPAGLRLRGHEFHYASVTARGGDTAFAAVSDAYGGAPEAMGGRRGNVTGSFFHALAEADSA